MDKKKAISIAAVVVVLACVGYFAWNWRPANNANAPDGTLWMCTKKDCKHEFHLTLRELSDHHEKNYGQPVPCPKCGDKKTVRGQKCVHCQKLIVMTPDPRPCPFCKKPQT